jgi:O-antigen/teichoic acid export membrane protein
VVAAASRWAGLPRLLGIPSGSALGPDTRALVLVCGVIFAASFTLNCSNQFAAALQCGYLGAYSQICASVLSCALLVVISFRGASVIQFALVMGVPPVLANFVLACYLFLIRHPGFRPSISQRSLASLRAISGCGTPIFISQLADMAVLYSANLLIANRLGPGAVPYYAVPFSAFMIAGALCWGPVAPYQPAYAEALGRGDFDWIRRTAIRVLKQNVALMGAAGLAVIAFGGFAIRIWTHGRVTSTRTFLAALAVYFVCAAATAVNGVLLIGIGRVKTKAALQGCVAAFCVLGSWLLLPRFGIVAVPVATTAGYFIDAAVALPLALRHLRHIETARQTGKDPERRCSVR